MNYICAMSTSTVLPICVRALLRPAFWAVIFITAVMSCDSGAASSPEVIRRFDREVLSYSMLDSAERKAFRDSFGCAADVVAAIVTGGECRNADDTFLERYSSDPKMRFYVPAIEQRLGSLDSVEMSLGLARGNALRMLPAVNWPDIYGVVLTYNQSVVSADSVMLVGLNHYLGPDYEPYSYFDEYQRYAKQKRLIPYHVAEALVSLAYPYRPSDDATALSRMVYEGAVVESVLRLLDSADIPAALGYTDEGYDWAVKNEAPAWNAMIEKNLVHTADMAEIDRLVRPAPHTTILHPSSPGRMGRFIGHRIVRSYLSEHADATLTEILDSAFYNSPQVLINSAYYPE